MPIYEYECEGPAKHRFEKWQSMKDDPVQECPECGTQVHKIFHPAGIIFKGSGWYITDSRKSSASETKSKSDTNSEGKEDSKSESKADTKSESKAEPKTETKSDSSGSSSSSNAKTGSSGE